MFRNEWTERLEEILTENNFIKEKITVMTPIIHDSLSDWRFVC